MKKKKKISPKFKGTTSVYDETGRRLSVGLVDVNTSAYVNWHRVWIKDLANVIGLLGEGKAKVFSYILSSTERSTNRFVGTIRGIANETSTSTRTVQTVINTLLDSDFMRKQADAPANYLVNPEILNYGSDKKIGYLMIQYSDLPEPTPLEKAIEKAKEEREFEEVLNSESKTAKVRRPKITLADD
ncbi:replication/maintenance protein RepL [Tunicatimonas pelagia]|uniref:replication/maintenance protein RepL n=1 Tax=Tunicatimonas pelagia TaxID=931531 RepID=UPI002665B79A|nr:replication/maintenance protein RepL [Tunicatimonas pelagia]WKN46519.1 replication/maintenance protein RepL [Tunicatimonas pelagia]